jgi:ATPase subunit of ABC transporter with duplicated ATPase domains
VNSALVCVPLHRGLPRSAFLDAVVTDIVVLADLRLTVFPGTLSEYEQRMGERASHHARMRDAKARKEKQAQEFIASAKQSTSKKPGKAKFIDPKKQQAAKTKKKKLERLGWHRSDGKAYVPLPLSPSPRAFALLRFALLRVRL